MHHCTKFMVHLQSGKDADVFDQEEAGDLQGFFFTVWQ